jgi:hypothetical protein
MIEQKYSHEEIAKASQAIRLLMQAENVEHIYSFYQRPPASTKEKYDKKEWVEKYKEAGISDKRSMWENKANELMEDFFTIEK